MAQSIKEIILKQLKVYLGMSAEEIQEDRYMKFRKMGVYKDMDADIEVDDKK
jgi:acetyl-CoA carboxylase alpha subunit